MKQSISPVLGAVVLIAVIGGLIFWMMRGSGHSGGGIAPMQKANPSPFGPGGAAVSGGAANADNQKRGGGTTGMPGGMGGQPR